METHERQTKPDMDAANAWNPGVLSAIPKRFLPLASLFRDENSFVGLATISERAEFTGLDLDELVIYRPERLALHSLLIRITANVAVSDGERYEDLGINFRSIAAQLEQCHVRPMLPAIRDTYEALSREVTASISPRLEAIMHPPRPSIEIQKGISRWLPWTTRPAPVAQPFDPERHRSAELEKLRLDAAPSQSDAGLDTICVRALLKLLTSLSIKHGRIVGDVASLSDIAHGLAMNVVASKRIGEMVEDGFADAVSGAGYELLPSQDRTVVLNTKGASASGKSTLRPLQHAMVERLHLNWRDFALISPDIWRKYLLDYDALGDAWRYAGSLSGMELRVVDHKLDLYMATRQTRQKCPHLLIDRFRFDSFQLSAQKKGEERLLTRFGDDIYMMFMVTPPEALVERAWRRGLDVGRFKPVDDLLDHCVEAYQGMPPLFFRWAVRRDKRVFYEFLDNSVAKGDVPNTIAFGQGGVLTILSIPGMLDISRFARINVQAKSPDQLWPDGDGHIAQDATFLRQCGDILDRLDLADRKSGHVYARFMDGSWQVLEQALWQRTLTCGITRSALDKLAETGLARMIDPPGPTICEVDGRTLGRTFALADKPGGQSSAAS